MSGRPLKVSKLMSHVPIRVSTLRGDQPIEFDAYVKINDKHILFLRRGDSFEGARLSRLKEKKLKKMFILQDDEHNYRKYLERNIENAFDPKSGKPIETRTEIVQGATQARAEDVLENADNVDVYNDAKAGASKFVEFLNRENQALHQILTMENLDQNIAQHGVTVSSLAITLASRLGLKDSKQNQLLSLGALLHDYEHFHQPLNIARPLDQFTPEELELYKQHPINGSRRLQDKKHFDQSVLKIIAQHEEFIDGKGFPQGLPENKLDILSIIVASANKLDRLLSFEKVPRSEIPKQLMMRYTGCHPLEHLQILSEIIKG